MADVRNDNPPTDPQIRLRELLQDTDISPEIAELRLKMLRADIPQAIVQIDSVRADDTAIAVKATINLPGGARHSHIAAQDVDTASSWSDQLAMVQATAVIVALDGLGSRSQASQPEARPTSVAPPRASAPAGPPEEDHLPEYSWNAFWQTLNKRNITREQVEQALGKSVQEVTPKEAVDALTSAGLFGS